MKHKALTLFTIFILPGLFVKTAMAANPTLGPVDFEAIASPLPNLAAPFRPQENANLNIGAIFNLVLPYLFIGAGLILLFMLIAGGFRMMTGANNEKETAAAGAQITNALIGFFLLFLSYWIVQVVAQILGIQVF